jgi:tRNA modification GTPase
MIDARVAVLTPPNRGAIAVLGLWGPHALTIADAVFRPAHRPNLSKTRPGVPRLGRAGDGLGDEVVAVVLKPGPGEGRSPSGPQVEFQCHGGAAASELVLGALTAAGATRAEPIDWVKLRAASPLRASAWSELGRASTTRVAEVLLDQSDGAFDREIEAVIGFLSQGSEAEAHKASAALEALVRRAEVGVRMVRGWRIVLAGRPNVGKSSLLNALAGYRRSIIDATPGTTRDVVTVELSLDGWPVLMSDTAGLRAPSEELEKIGIERARRAHETADLVLPVLDRSQPLTAEDVDLLRRPSGGPPVAVNKSDLAPAWDPADVEDLQGRAVIISARDQSGLGLLVSALARRVVPEPPPSGSGVPWRDDHVGWLREAARALSVGDRPGAVVPLLRLLGSEATD